MQPWECDGVIECGSVVVRPGGCPRSGRTGPRLPPGSSHTLTRTLAHRPGDAIIGDQDGVVCIPAAVAEKVYELAHHRETIEGIIKEELVKNPGPPGKYYPFKPPIKPESPLGKLLTTKGIKFYSTRAGGGAARRSSPFANGGRRHMSSVPPTMKVA